MNWYVAEPLLYNVAGSSPSERAVQCCHYLVTAEDHDLAYEKSMVMGNQLSTGDRRFAGLSDLLLVHETPADGAELLWTQTEMTPAELDNEVQPKKQMRAFLGKQSSLSGWYVAQVMLYEVHDEGSHGPNLLTWINSYLIKANDAETAYLKALQVGKGQEDEPGSHTCDGERAHWLLKGLRDLVPVRDAPADKALLWCSAIKASVTQFESMVRKKSDLGVFRWQAEQLQRRASRR